MSRSNRGDNRKDAGGFIPREQAGGVKLMIARGEPNPPKLRNISE